MVASCPQGKIRRRAYTRKDGTYIKSTCVIDKGKPGKTPKNKRVLPKPTPGSLGKYGYHDVKHTPAEIRRKALTKAVKDAGYATIIRRVNLIANYSKTSDPQLYKRMRSDIAWMQKNLKNKYSAEAKRSRKTSRKASRKSSRKTGRKRVKAGTKNIGGRNRQLYRLQGSTSKFYMVRQKDGTYARRYVRN